MRIINGVGTYTFPTEKCTDIGDYGINTRDYFYKSIDGLNSSSNIGSENVIEISFFQLSVAELGNLKLIFNASKVSNASITQIDDYDEVLTGESYTKLLGATNGIFIETKKWNQKKSIKSKDIKFYNARFVFRFDTATTHIK